MRNEPRLTFHRTGRETLHDASLENSDEQDQRDRAHDDRGRNRTPRCLVNGRAAERRDAGSHRFHAVVRHEGEREEKFVPSKDEDENGGGRERRRRQRENDSPENLKSAETI